MEKIRQYSTKVLSAIFIVMLAMGMGLLNHDHLTIFKMPITTLLGYDGQLIFELFLMVILYQRYHELSLLWVLFMGGLLLTVLNMQFYLSIAEISQYTKAYGSFNQSLYRSIMIIQGIMNILSCGLLCQRKEYRF